MGEMDACLSIQSSDLKDGFQLLDVITTLFRKIGYEKI